MSTRDIVTELRDHQNGGRRAECEAAAAEIERLRAANIEILHALQAMWNMWQEGATLHGLVAGVETTVKDALARYAGGAQ